MGFTRKKLFAFILVGSLTFGIPFITVCFSLCPTVDLGSDFSHIDNCTFSSHSYVQIGIGQSTLFIPPHLGLFLIIGRYNIPEGFSLLPFKPPRFHT